MTEVLADHHNATITTNDFALIANFLDAWLDLHDPPYVTLLVPINNSTSGEVIRT